MRYSVAKFDYTGVADWQRELFEQALADIGFDSFIENEAYIPTAQLNPQQVVEVASEHAIALLSISDCADKNWNATWEQEHPAMELPMGVTIVPHCAFGAGYHETTNMLINALINSQLEGKDVLDNGCGTGVLGIMAAKLGAHSVTAIDIDENSVTNTHENAERNGVTIDIRLGDTPPEGSYDLILSNIHKNILLRQMPVYARLLKPHGELWMSGFYEADVPELITEANRYGLQLLQCEANNEWRSIRIIKN